MSQNKLVLVVEDSQLLQKVAFAHLKMFADVDVHVANNGLEAIEAVKANRYELILMDIQMPIMDGLTASIEIRKLQEQQGWSCPIVAVTASTPLEDCLAAGMDECLHKPAHYETIVSLWLAKYRKDPPSPSPGNKFLAGTLFTSS